MVCWKGAKKGCLSYNFDTVWVFSIFEFIWKTVCVKLHLWAYLPHMCDYPFALRITQEYTQIDFITQQTYMLPSRRLKSRESKNDY